MPSTDTKPIINSKGIVGSARLTAGCVCQWVNVVFEIAIRRYTVEILSIVFDKCSHIVAHVDDVIMGRRLQDFKEVFISLVEQTNKMGLEK
jgi:hypothetical protein